MTIFSFSIYFFFRLMSLSTKKVAFRSLICICPFFLLNFFSFLIYLLFYFVCTIAVCSIFGHEIEQSYKKRDQKRRELKNHTIHVTVSLLSPTLTSIEPKRNSTHVIKRNSQYRHSQIMSK